MADSKEICWKGWDFGNEKVEPYLTGWGWEFESEVTSFSSGIQGFHI